MAKKSKGAFADAGAAVSKAFHDLERAVMGMMSTPTQKAGTAKKATKAKKTKAKKKARR